MRFNKTAIKSIAATLLLGQLNMALQPLYAATREDKGASSPMVRSQIERMQALQRDIDAAKARKAQESLSPADQASQRLARVEELVRDIAFLDEPPQASTNAKQQDQVRAIGPNLKARLKPLTAEQKAQRHDRRQQLTAELKGLLSQQTQDQAAVRAEFAQTRQTLLDRKLPAEILARHDEAVAKFEQRVAQFNQSAGKAQQGDAQALAELQNFFDQNPTKRKAAPVDPAKLPWRTPEPTKRLPAETQTAWFQNLYANKGTRLAQVGNSLEGLEFVTPPEPGVAPTAADLAETPETQRTAAIKAKALELGNNPVNIQNWVRNNVEWVPTWGAIQSAQDTLDKKRGNAIDIASLEIALLRAAKIPARYQFGTIELPAEQVMNWVGGVSKPEAAQQLLGQGGIANRGLIEGGRISKIRMEHAWVQAYVNWLPSRGAKQGSATQHPSPQAQRNAWVPLDPSFKQYSYAPAIDLKAVLPFDMAAAIDAATQGATVNEAEGWVQNANQNAIQTRLSDYQARLNALLAAQGPQATVGDIVGKKIISAVTRSVLSEAAQYVVVQVGSALDAVPSKWQHKFTYNLYASAYDKALDNPLLTYVEATSQLAGKKVTLNYVPATQADADLIASYLPKQNSQGGVRSEDFPASLPAYLIKMIAELRVDGVVVARGSSAMPMGTDLVGVGGFTNLSDISAWDLSEDESNTVGQATAIGMSVGGIGSYQINALSSHVKNMRTAMRSVNSEGITGYDVWSTVQVGLIWSWFATIESQAKISALSSDVVSLPTLSYGLFHTTVTPVSSWGVIRAATFKGITLDVGHVRSAGADKTNNMANWRRVNLQNGQYMSALEGYILELYAADAGICSLSGESGMPCPEGKSAVSLISKAAEQGQKIYNITSAMYGVNPSIVSAAVAGLSSGTRVKILSALDAGYDVSFHSVPLVMGGWKGAGYVIIDPATGAGGYLIEGGANGGDLEIPFALPSCQGGFWSTMWANFIDTNKLVPGGLALPPLSTFLTAGVVADALGGITFLKLVFNWSALVAAGLQGVAILVFLMTAIINFIIMSLVFEAGILIGSAGVAAAACSQD